ncbi:MAG: SGNH/GDSL hydrolase family protein [Clostridiales bacterium]|nr:SGNH/GDSL hydrolase family protein [Clostridiales bacterium]
MNKIITRTAVCLFAAAALCLSACGSAGADTDESSVSEERSISEDSSTTENSSAAEGRFILEELEQQDVAAVQNEIDDLHAQAAKEAAAAEASEAEAAEAEKEAEEAAYLARIGLEDASDVDLYNLSEDEIRKLNFQEIFSGCIVMGDSLTEGIYVYEYLNSSQVIYTNGISIPSTDNHLAQAQALNPRVVFLSYGSNDISHIHYDYERFREEFDDFLNRAQAALPDAELYVNLIFPARAPLTEQQPWYTETAQYNAVIIEVCGEHGIPYIDSTGLVSDEYYSADGYHFYGSFYPLWLYNMAKEAHLL